MWFACSESCQKRDGILWLWKISTWSYNVYIAKNKLIILEFKQATTKAEVGNNSFKNETALYGKC